MSAEVFDSTAKALKGARRDRDAALWVMYMAAKKAAAARTDEALKKALRDLKGSVKAYEEVSADMALMEQQIELEKTAVWPRRRG